MPALLIRHRVADYSAWSRVFDEQAYARTANGCQRAQIFCNTSDPHEMVIILTWDTLVRARLYTQSDDWLDSLTRGGVTTRPDLCFLDEVPEHS